ncbi:IlvD/Edd family dehydratase [Saccharopolyspora sp. SCSIO 74807]|uniref:IlvD/Edd family dehydratase n=1 Tax=Saccharopolyspora sp. SCSIO 74807 TaxID=3118084 RepID=UPI0030CACD16
MTGNDGRRLRSQDWFDIPGDPGTSVLMLERFLNYGLSRAELQAGKPVIGIAQTGSDLSPCNRHHLELAQRLREGIREAGGVAMEFPVHPIQETARRPTAALDRNLAYLGLVEVLHGYPLDGVVLTTGCDKTTPAALMAAATADLPAIVLSGGPMLNGWVDGGRCGSGTVLWAARKKFAAGEIDEDGYWNLVSAGTPSAGHCNTMGTASTMNALAEALGMSLPGNAAIPAPHRERAEMAYRTGLQAVELVRADRKPSQVLTRDAFHNAIVVNSALGGSSNAPIHLNAIAQHAGVGLTLDDWERIGQEVPLLLNMQPGGTYLGEDFHRAGGVPAVLAELADGGLLRTDAVTVNGSTIAENLPRSGTADPDVIHPFASVAGSPGAGFRVLRGNLFDSAIMKTSVISAEFRARYLSDPESPNAFTARAIVFDGPEDYHERIEDPGLRIDADCILVMRGSGPLGHPGSAEVVNMQPPAALLGAGVEELPCMGDGRQSGTSGSPSILNAAPEAAAGGRLAILRTGDAVRVDLNAGRVDVLIGEDEITQRERELADAGGYPVRPHQTPWQQIYRESVSQLDDGGVHTSALAYREVGRRENLPRYNH